MFDFRVVKFFINSYIRSEFVGVILSLKLTFEIVISNIDYFILFIGVNRKQTIVYSLLNQRVPDGVGIIHIVIIF